MTPPPVVERKQHRRFRVATVVPKPAATLALLAAGAGLLLLGRKKK